GWAGLLNEALDANNAAMQGLSDVEMFDHEFLGYNVEHWVMSLRGRILVRLGRLMEAQQCLNMLLRIEQTLLDPAVKFIPHLGYVDLAWCRGDAALAEKHALRVSEIAEKVGFPTYGSMHSPVWVPRRVLRRTSRVPHATSPRACSSSERPRPRWGTNPRCWPASPIVITK